MCKSYYTHGIASSFVVIAVVDVVTHSLRSCTRTFFLSLMLVLLLLVSILFPLAFLLSFSIMHSSFFDPMGEISFASVVCLYCNCTAVVCIIFIINIVLFFSLLSVFFHSPSPFLHFSFFFLTHFLAAGTIIALI